MEKVSEPRYCSICDRKLSNRNRFPACFHHYEDARVKDIIIICNIFGSQEQKSCFGGIVGRFIKLNIGLVEKLAKQHKMDVKTIQCWADGRVVPSMAIQRKVITNISRKFYNRSNNRR